jgi:hypothetical protein
MYHILVEILLLVVGFQTSGDPISKCETLFDQRKISKSILLTDDYIDFDCGDSAEIRSVTGNMRSRIEVQGGYCRIESKKKIDFNSYQVASCDSASIRFRRNYIQYFTLSQRQISAIAYDTIVVTERSAYRQSSSLMPVYILSVIGLIGVGYVISEILDGIRDYHMPDP